MRDAISGAWLYSIIIVFTLFMVAFVSISLNYHNVFKMKTEIVSAIEQYSGLTPDSEKRIRGIMEKHGYNIKKTCTSVDVMNESTSNGQYYLPDFYGINQYGTTVKNPKEPVSVCIYKQIDPTKDKVYYTVETFFGFVLPVVGDLSTFRVKGDTKSIEFLTDKDKWYKSNVK